MNALSLVPLSLVQCISPPRLGSRAALLAGLLTLGLGSPTMAQQVWGGSGQILSGQGQGATVQLTVEMDQGQIRTQSGPPLNAPFSGGSQAIQTEDGMWQIQQYGNQLSVTLHRGDQVIRYQLLPQSLGPEAGSPAEAAPIFFNAIPNAVPVVDPTTAAPQSMESPSESGSIQVVPLLNVPIELPN